MRRGRRLIPWCGLLAALLALAGCSSGPKPGIGVYKVGQPYQINGRWYHPQVDPDYDRTGTASWYGDPFHGRATANGERFDKRRLSAAHPTLPLPSIVRVTNLANNRSVDLRVNDRGPFVGDRIIDLSQAAARELGFERHGLAPVRVQYLGLAEARGRPPAMPPPRQPPPPPPEPTYAAAAPAQCLAPGRYIQIGAFAEPARAVQLARRLDGAVPAPVEALPPAGDRLARVRLGPLHDAIEASRTLHRLKTIGYADAYLVEEEAMPIAC
jgi:rare lipoprotein A